MVNAALLFKTMRKSSASPVFFIVKLASDLDGKWGKNLVQQAEHNHQCAAFIDWPSRHRLHYRKLLTTLLFLN